MGTQEITAARYYQGVHNKLNVDRMAVTGFDTTWSVKPGPIGVALNYQRTHPDTLIVVTADHGHTSQIVSEDASGSGLPTCYSTNVTTKDDQTLTLTYGTSCFGGDGKAPAAAAAEPAAHRHGGPGLGQRSRLIGPPGHQ